LPDCGAGRFRNLDYQGAILRLYPLSTLSLCVRSAPAGDAPHPEIPVGLIGAGNLVSETATERRSRRVALRRKQRALNERGPKLMVLSVSRGDSTSGGSTVECQLETTRHKTVTFQFDYADYVPGDIANNLVSPSHIELYT